MKKSRIAGVIVGLALSALLAGFHISGLTSTIEVPFWDRWLRLRGPLARPPQIVIVGVDERSLVQDRSWPLPDAVLVQLVSAIERDEPAVVALSTEWSNLYGRKKQPAGELAKLGSHKNLVLPAVAARRPGPGGGNQLDRPVAEASGLIGALVPASGRGGIVREFPTSYSIQGEVHPAFEVVVARLWAEASGEPAPEAALAGTVRTNFIGPPGTIAYEPAERWLRGEAPTGLLKGKIVIVGSYLPAARNLAWTPGCPAGCPMAEAELLANEIATLISGSGLREIPGVAVAAGFLAIGTLLLPVFGMIGITRAVLLLALLEITSLFGFHELALRGVVGPPLTTGILVLFCFLAALPIRSLKVGEWIRAHVLAAPLVPHEGASIALVEGGQRFWGEVALESRRLLDFDALAFIVRRSGSNDLGLVRFEGMEPARVRPGAWRLGKPPFREARGAVGPAECPPLFDDPEVLSYLSPFLYGGEVFGFLALGTKRGPTHVEGRSAIVKQISLTIATELRRREGRMHLSERGILSLSAQSEKTILAEVGGLEETLHVAQDEREIMEVALRHADGGVIVSDVFGRVTRMSPGIEAILAGERANLGWGVDDLPEFIALFAGIPRERAIGTVNELLESGREVTIEASLPPDRKEKVNLRLAPVSRRVVEGGRGAGGRAAAGRVLAIVGSLGHPAGERANVVFAREIRDLLANEAIGNVNAIQGFTQILDRAGGLTGATREYLAAIQANVKDLHALLGKVVSRFSGGSAGKGSGVSKAIPAGEVCREIVEAMAPEARKKGVALLLEAPREDDPAIEGAGVGERERGAIQALLADLIARSGGSDSVEVAVRRDGDRARIQIIWASGAAGSEEALKQVAEAARSAFGLGGEDLEATLDPGMGGRFEVWLPAVR